MSPTAVMRPADGGVSWHRRANRAGLECAHLDDHELVSEDESSRMCRVTPISVLMLPDAASVGPLNCRMCASIDFVLLFP